MGFVVQAMEAAAPPAYEPRPEPPRPAPPKPTKLPKPAAKPTQPEVIDAVIVDAAVVSPPKVKEVVWSEGTDAPPPKKTKKPLKPELADDADEPDDTLLIRRKKKKRNRGPIILAGMAIISAAVVIFAVFYILYYQGKNEEKLAEAAREQYDKGEYHEASKSYDKLLAEYPESKNVDEYRFFSELSTMQTAVRSVTNRENYEGGIKRLRDFIDKHKDSHFAKPTTGYGRDIFEAGKKLGEDIAAHAEDRVKAFQGDRANKSGELVRAEQAIADGRELIPLVEGFRGQDDPQLSRLRGAFDEAEKNVKHERARTAAINSARAKLVDPTDALILSAEADLQAAGFLDDPEAQSLLAAAKGRLRDLVRYEDDPAAAQPPPPTTAASLLFVTPLGKTKLHEPAAGDPPSSIFLCVARGILYAIDEDNGAVLWATRVGPDVIEPPALARIELATGLTDLAIVTSNVGNAPAVTAYVLKTGTARWYQPLPAPAAGKAVILGNRAFIPVRDERGTIYEFDLTTGTRIGHIRLGQTVAEHGAVLRPGTGYLYVAADARRVYVIDVGGRDDDGNRIPPRCVQVIATGHLAGTLRVPLLFIGPDGKEPAARWMLLAQAEGTARTQLRAFRIERIDPPPVDGASVPETLAMPEVSLPVPGWVNFAPICDGEKLALITDTGHFRLFGVRQPGNDDRALFPIAAPSPPAALDRVLPGLAIPLEESTYWLVVAGQLQKARLTMVHSKGQDVVFTGTPMPVGEPVHAGQFNSRRDTVCIVVRARNSSGCRAIAFDVKSGEIRWQRQLGLVPAKMITPEQLASPIVQADRFILVDEDGGIVAVPTASNIGIGQTVTASPDWVLASAPTNATGPTLVAASPSGKVIYTVTPVRQDGAKFVIRRIVNGKVAHEDMVNAPAELAGLPGIVGESLLIPTADGFVNRLIPGDGRVIPGSLSAGPAWQGERRIPGAVCNITPLTDTTFATSDGGKKLTRWEWPVTGKWNQAGVWELREGVAGPGIVLPPAAPGDPPRLTIADTAGGVYLLPIDRGGQPLPRWRPGGTAGIIPGGKPTPGFAIQATDTNGSTLAYVVDGRTAVAVNPARDEALWTASPREDANNLLVGLPQPDGANRWVLTDLSGRVLVIDGSSGEVVATQSVGLPGAVPAAAGGVVADRALIPLSDGSAVLIELPKK